MKKSAFLFSIPLFVCSIAFGQITEKLFDLDYNYNLDAHFQDGLVLRSAPKSHVNGRYIVLSDTLNVPFQDDFSNDFTQGEFFENKQIQDTIFALGACVDRENTTKQRLSLIKDTAWSYTFDVNTQVLDSMPLPRVNVFVFNQMTSCFDGNTEIRSFWNPYYRYVFDSISGQPIDSIFIGEDTVLQVATYIRVKASEEAKWLDNTVYINSTLPINPPTRGVATFDGLNALGRPYDNSTSVSQGFADKLTSKPINLSTISASDSVYFSFLYQPMGLGNFPDIQDSLILEFRDSEGVWNRVWSISGYKSIQEVPRDTFKVQLINISDAVLASDPNYFYGGFQFRFRNKASLTGNVDHWHIDYVLLDTGRSSIYSPNDDIAFTQDRVPSFLKFYDQMPWDQFESSLDLLDTLPIFINNVQVGVSPGVFQLNFDVADSQGNVIYQDDDAIDGLIGLKAIDLFPAQSYIFPDIDTDSLAVHTTISKVANDENQFNDTLRGTQIFDNELAYDDGTAESSYGVIGKDFKQVAYRFKIRKPDTLSAIKIHYSNIREDVSQVNINIKVWDEINQNVFNPKDPVLVELVNKKPFYIDQRDGFIVYKLDTPVVVTDDFYIGWSQESGQNIQLGYDLNSTKGYENIFVFTNFRWRPTRIPTKGSLMIRAVLDGDFSGEGTPTTVKPTLPKPSDEKLSLIAYPNPTGGNVNIYIQSEKENKHSNYILHIYDRLGHQILTKEISINGGITLDMSAYASGVYIVGAQCVRTGDISYIQIVKIN